MQFKNYKNSRKKHNNIMLKVILTLFFINQIAGDLVIHLDYGGRVPTDDRFDVLFKYDADANRDCEIALKKPSENWRTYAYRKISCGAGKDIAKALTLTYSANPVAGTGYVIEIKILSGTTQTAYRSYDVVVQNGKQGFHTYQGKLYDANRNIFTIRGINNAHGDYDGSGGGTGGKRWWARNALKNIAATRSNTVRILWRTNNDLSSVDLDSVIQESINQKLIPMVELHDATGSSNSADLQRLAQWWANNVWLLIKHRRFIIVNIANEWSPWGYGTSFSSYLISTNSLINILKTLNIFMERCLYTSNSNNKVPFDTSIFSTFIIVFNNIRNAGYSGNLVVDAAAYAQNPNSIKTHGAEVYNSDPYKNILFSLHLYGKGQ